MWETRVVVQARGGGGEGGRERESDLFKRETEHLYLETRSRTPAAVVIYMYNTMCITQCAIHGGTPSRAPAAVNALHNVGWLR